MLKIRRNFDLLLVFIKRCITDSSHKEHKHYEFFIRHIKTDLNNHSYIVKQTTAIPKEISNLSPISYRDIACTIGSQTSYNPLLPSTKHSKFKITNDTENKFLEKNVLIQDVVNKLVTHYSTKEHNLNSSNYNHDIVEEIKNLSSTNDTPSYINEYRNDLFSKNDNYKEYIKSNYQDYSYPTQLKQIATSFLDDTKTYDISSLTKIKELLSAKIKDVLMTSFLRNIFSDDVVILNQKIPERESLLFFKNKDLHVIESSHTNFKKEVKNYIKNVDIKGGNRSAPERLNLVRFFKVYSAENFFGEPLSYNSSNSKGHLSIQPYSHFSNNNCSELISTVNSWDGTILRVKKSVPIERNAEKFWISYDEDNNNVKEVSRDNFEHVTSQSYNGFFSTPQSGPPFTEKVPINKDKLIEENVVPNTSILNIINSIDKSAVIIQKDLYITDQIIQKIQKEEEEKHKVIDKNKLETTAKKSGIIYLGAPSVKNGLVTLSLSGLTAGIKEVLSNDKQGELDNSNNNQSLIRTENSTKERNKSLQQQSLSIKKNVNVSQRTSNEFNSNKYNDLPASVTLNSIDDSGKLTLNMLYEPNNVIPMFSFFPKKQIFEDAESNIITKASDNILLNNNINQSHHSTSKDKFKNNETEKLFFSSKSSADNPQPQSSQCSNNNNLNRISVSKVNSPDKAISLHHQGNPNHITTTKLNYDNNQLPTTRKNRLKLVENKFLKKKITDKCEKISSKPVKEEPRYTIPENRSQGNSLKDNTPHKNISVYHTTTITPGEGVPMDVYLNRNTTTNLQNTGVTLTQLKKKISDSDMNSSGEVIPIDNVINSNNSTLNSQDKSYKLFLNGNGQIKNLENELSKLKKLISESKKKNSSQKLSDVEKLLETLIKDYFLKKEMPVSNDLKNESENIFLETPKEEPSYIAQNRIADIVKSVETLLKNYILKEEISISNAEKNESENKCLETPKEESSYIAQNRVTDIVKSVETLLKNYILKGEISVSNTQRNESENKCLETPKEEPSHIAHNIVPDIIESLEPLLKDYILKREISHYNDLKNDLEKKYSEIPKEELSHNAQHIVQAVTESVKNWLKYNIRKKGISVSNGVKNESEKKNLETHVEEHSHTVPNIMRSLKPLLKDYFSKTETETPDEEILMDKHVNFYNAITHSEDNDYQPPITTNSELEVMEKDFLKQEKITQVPEKECSEILEEEPTLTVELLPKKETSGSNINYPIEDHEYFFNPNNMETNSKDKNVLQNKNKILVNINDKKLSEDNIQEYNNKPQFYSLDCSNEASKEFIINEEDTMESSRPISKEGSYYENNAILSDKNKNKILVNINDKKLSEDNIQEYNNKSQFYSLDSSNETSNEFIKNEEDTMEPSKPISKKGSYHENNATLSNINSLERESDVEFPFKNNTHSNLSTIYNNESNQLLLMESDDVLPELSSISHNSGKGSFDRKKNVEKLNKFVPTKTKFESSNINNSSVDRVKKTTISSVEQNNFTDINVSEVETYVDSRLPIPFSTETFFQIFGSNHSLRDHSSLIDVAKYRLTSPNKITDQRSNLRVMAKLDDIHKSVQYLNFLAINSKSLNRKDTMLKNKVLVPSKEVSESSANNQRIAKHSIKEHTQNSKTETTKNNNEETINKESEPNLVPKRSLKIFKDNSLHVKAHNLKKMSKQNLQNQKITSEIKKQEHKTSSKHEKSLLVVEPKNEDIKETKKMDQKKPGIQKAALTGIRVSKGKYVDLFNFKNEKTKRHKVKLQGYKKGVYDHRGLSKRDRKILREITKEIPKQKSKRKNSRKRPIRPITSKKNLNEIEQPTKSLLKKSKDVASKVTLPKKDSESVDNTHLLNKQKLLPQGKHAPEKKEVQKSFPDKIENTSHKVVSRVANKSVENKKVLKSERKKSKDSMAKHGKTIEKIKISEAKSTKAEKFNVSNKGNLKQVTKSEKKLIKNAESRISNNDGGNIDKIYNKPLCQTYVATETYVNQPEKTYLIPEKIFTSKKIFKKNPSLQKVTILENVKSIKEDNSNTLKIHEGFKEELIRKSQNKIEHRTNIDFRVRTPKLRNPKSKFTTFKSKQNEKLGPATMFEQMPMLKNYTKKSDIKNKHFVPKNLLKNKLDHVSSKEIRTSQKTNITKKAGLVQNIKNEQSHKVNQLGQRNKEIFSQPKSKTAEIINTKSFDRMAKGTEKHQDKEQLKIVATDKLKPPIEPKIAKKVPKIGPTENMDKKNFPLLLIDVDKMSKEIKPELDLKNCQKCQVTHDKITDFPLHSQKKKLLFKPPFKILNLGPSNDPMLRNELKIFPSVTKVLNSTIPENSREILREWRKNMIDELGENGFKSFYKGQLINGNKFNWQLHNFLLRGEKDKEHYNNLSLKSIEGVLRRTSDLSAINSHVIHRKLAYRGVIDCVAKYQNRPVLIEWKRLENPQVKIGNSSIDVAATQLAAYVGALNSDDTYKFQISGGLIVLAYNDGSEAKVIEISNEQCYKHWKMWLRRLQMYHESSRKKAK